MRVINEVKKRGAMVDEAIERLLPLGEPEELYHASKHLVDAGGKRLRPATVMIAAEAVGGQGEDVIPAAVAVELVHTFTLIHDDIMDDDTRRRGRPTVHTMWHVPAAILAGDTLYSKAFEILTMMDAPPERVVRCLEILAHTCTDICEGQWLDIEFEDKDNVTEEEYMQMIRKKTAVLYAAAASIGGILGGGSEEQVQALWDFGCKTGMGFQIFDDVLDLTGDEDKMGKDWGSDIVEGKRTLIMIHAISQGIQPSLPEEASKEEIKRYVKQLEDAGSIDYARNRAKNLVEDGKRGLRVLPDGEARSILCELADYMINRGY